MTLDVVLVPPLPCERWVSIERYVQAIVSGAQGRASIRVTVPPASQPGTTTGIYRARYREYRALFSGASAPADIVHIPDQALAHLADAFAGTPIAVTCHDLMPLFLEQGAGSRFASWMDRTLLRHSLERMSGAERIITVSETTRGDVVRLLDVDPERISVVPNSLHPAYRAIPEPEQRHRLLPPRPRVLSVGRVAPYKNLEPLFLALARPALAGASLVRVGEPLTGTQRQLADRLGVLSRTTELGHVDPRELARVYRACDVLAQPSLYEGFGVPLVEAMACGLPVVCSDGGALPEVAADAAIVVPLASDDFPASLAGAIETILCDRDTASTLRQRGFSHAELFRPEPVFTRLLEAYRTAIKEHAS